MVCKGITSRYEVAKKILQYLNLQDKVNLVSVSSDYFAKEYFAPRPLSERLLTTKLDLRNINVMRQWEDALKEYIDNSYLDLKCQESNL